MSKYNESVLTTAGLELATRAFRGQAKFNITRTATTADTLTEAEIKGLAKLPNEKQAGTLTSSLDTPDGDERIAGTKVLYTNEKVTKGYEISAIGLYAKEEGKDTEFLYAVTLAAEPEYMPDFGDKVLFEFGMSIFVMVGQKQNVTIQLNPQSLATIEYVDKAIADHQVVFPSDLAYLDKDQTVTGKWKFSQNPVDKNGDEYVSGKVANKYADGLDSKVLHQATQLSPKTDLYSLLDGEKYYYANSNSLAATMVNSPTVLAFTISTRTISAGAADGKGTYKIIALTLRDFTGKEWQAVIATDGDGKQIVNSSWTLGQQQAIFNTGTYNIANSNKIEFATYLRESFDKPGIFSIRSENNGVGSDGVEISVIDAMVISEGSSFWYAWGIAFNTGAFYSRKVTAKDDTGWKRAADVGEMLNWQKKRNTNDDGTPLLNLMNDGKTDVNATLGSLSAGIYTAYIQSGAINNPCDDSMRGIINATGSGFSTGFFSSNNLRSFFYRSTESGVIWKEIAKQGDFDPSVFAKRVLTAADDVLSLSPGTYSTNGQAPKNMPTKDFTPGWSWIRVSPLPGANAKLIDIKDVDHHHLVRTYAGAVPVWSDWTIPNTSEVVHDNHDGSVKINGVSYVPADNSKVMHRNSATGEVVEKLYAPGGITLAGGHVLNISNTDGLTIDGKPLYIKVSDEATAKTNSANDKLHYYYTEES